MSKSKVFAFLYISTSSTFIWNIHYFWGCQECMTNKQQNREQNSLTIDMSCLSICSLLPFLLLAVLVQLMWHTAQTAHREQVAKQICTPELDRWSKISPQNCKILELDFSYLQGIHLRRVQFGYISLQLLRNNSFLRFSDIDAIWKLTVPSAQQYFIGSADCRYKASTFPWF